MRERPILFNGAMVRAILSGHKTQTRRVMKPQPVSDTRFRSGFRVGGRGSTDHRQVSTDAPAALLGEVCPFGQPGDRLWVRETWRPQTIHSCAMDTCDCDGVGVTYAADNEWIPHTWQNPVPDDWCMPDAAARGNVPSIHMPRWACRLVLEITAVRVERLQAISEADAIAEGTTPSIVGADLQHLAYRAGFQTLWTSTGGDWDSNPWVWVIEFNRINEVSNG